MPRTHDRPLTCAALAPGEGLTPAAGGFAVARPHVRFCATARLAPGWYEVRLACRSADRFAVRKRVEVVFEAADGGVPAAREPFAWNREFAERFMLRLTRPACGVRLDIWHAEGALSLDEFCVRRVRGPRVVARALGEKVRLTRSYNCLGPALGRGVRLLRRGRFREFGTKLVNGLSDARSMRLGTVALAEVNAAWTRRHALNPAEAARVRAAIDRMECPPPLAVLLPLDPARLDAARVAAQSVARQLYPHWTLYVCAAADAKAAGALKLLENESRQTVVRAEPRDGRAAAVARAMARADGERVLVLPPEVELAEDALFQLASAFAADPGAAGVGLRVAAKLGSGDLDGGAVWLADPKRLSDSPPESLAARDWAAWAGGGTLLDGVAAYPIDDRPLAEAARVGTAAASRKQRLHLAADLRGIGGYDHLTFAVLQGLPSVGAELVRHPVAVVRADLVPPRLMPREPSGGRDGEAMLAVGPPFLVPRFGLDKRSAAFTMWETDTLDPVWVPLLSEAAVVVVPSEWQAREFRRDGVKCPVEVAPLGFDPVAFHPAAPPPEVCTFGTAGALTSGGVRKNAQWVIDTFRAAFPREHDVRLRVKVSPGSTGVETHDDPRIDVLRAALPASELAEWYRSLTCYVNGSSGEGFGLHLIEAMACGRPLVTPELLGVDRVFHARVGLRGRLRLGAGAQRRFTAAAGRSCGATRPIEQLAGGPRRFGAGGRVGRARGRAGIGVHLEIKPGGNSAAALARHGILAGAA